MERTTDQDGSNVADRRVRRFRRRYRSTIVRDSLGSRNTFRQFYQNGGRDYEQYRLWLADQTRLSPSSSEIKLEPIELVEQIFPPRMNEPPQYVSRLVPIASSNYSRSLADWSVDAVSQFAREHFPETNLPQKFAQQKIDGRTLPLLNEDHLRRVFKMKLGPTLRLLALINELQSPC